jgi:hypothetical protein
VLKLCLDKLVDVLGSTCFVVDGDVSRCLAQEGISCDEERSGTERLKAKNGVTARPSDCSSLAMVCTIADFPLPAAPCSISVRSLVGCRAQERILDRIATRVSRRQTFEVLTPASCAERRLLMML